MIASEPRSGPPDAGFYYTGGAVPINAPSYVERQADHAVYEALRHGEFCYVLTTRQMGKSSLMIRTATRLREEGTAVAVLDLTAIGNNVTVEQWYDGLLGRLGRQLDLEDALEDYWLDHERLGPLQRFLAALEEVALAQCPGRLVIFVDEIDLVRSLPFSTDEFFAGIRECYHRRNLDPAFARLTFCLLGVAAPSDLIRDPRTTPFNIGRRIELADFTPAEAQPLAQGLGRDPETGRRLLERILYWTGGHPYLTQRLCESVAQDAAISGPDGVDRLCDGMFLSARAREQDSNLAFVADRLLRGEADVAAVLDLYAKVYRGRKVKDGEANPLVSALRLSGVAGTSGGFLKVRNRIYAQVFDAAWVAAGMPDAERRRQRAAARRAFLRTAAIAAVIIALLAAETIYALTEAHTAHTAERAARQALAKFQDANGRLTRDDATLKQADTALTVEKSTLKQSNATLQTNKQQLIAALKVADKATQDAGAKKEALLKQFYDQVQEYDGYYAEFINRRGFWGGVGRLTPEQAAHRDHSFKFIRHGRKNPVDEVVAVDGMGRLTTNHSVDTYIGTTNSGGADSASNATTMCRWVFTRDSRGRISREQAFDRRGRPVYTFYYTSDNTGVYLNPLGYPTSRTATGATYVRFQWDPVTGFPVKKHYTDRQGQPQTDQNGEVGERDDYDGRGLAVRAVSLNGSGKPQMRKDGYAIVTTTYDRFGRATKVAYRDAAGRLTLNQSGYALMTVAYDRFENQTSVSYYGTDGRPVLSTDGRARITYQYDAHGNQTEAASWGIDGRPILRKSGYAKVRYDYDRNGNTVRWTYDGLDGRPTWLSDGYAILTAQYDGSGNEVAMAYHAPDGSPTRSASGISRMTFRYDANGNEIDRRYLNIDGRPTLFTDSDGDRYARLTARYDAAGNKVEQAFYDVRNHLTAGKDGYALLKMTYDDRGNVAEWRIYGRDSKPVLSTEGYFLQRASYDAHGNQITRSYYDKSGKPTLCQEADGVYARIGKQYDSHGNETHVTYYGPDGWPMPLKKEGYAQASLRYDARGNLIQVDYFDAQGRRALYHDDGDLYARVVKQYDGYGNNTQTTYYDLGLRPIRLQQSGYTFLRRRYDALGRIVAWIYLDANHRPTLFTDSDGDRYAQSRIAYDARGNTIAETYYGLDGHPVRLQKEGYSTVKDRYDARGNKLEVDYLGPEGRLTTIRPSGVARIRYGYDQLGDRTTGSYFGADGRLCLMTDDDGDRYARFVNQHDSRGNITEASYYGPDGRLIQLTKSGYARLIQRFDGADRLIEQQYEGPDGRPRRDNFARLTYRYNGAGDLTEVEAYQADGTQRPTGSVRLDFRYDSEGNQLSETRYDAGGRVVK